MKKFFVWVGCLVLVLGFGLSQADAAGFGFYGSAGSGSGDYSEDLHPSIDVDSEHSGAGFVFDSAVAKDKLFNYQLNIGYDKPTITNSAGQDLDLSGLLISNTFGFGIIRTEGFRLWLGPEIRLAFPSGTYGSYDYDLVGLGFGPAIGMNFNLPGSLTLGIKTGYQVVNYAGEATSAYNTNDVEINEKMIYLNFSVMFRTSGDRY